MAEDASGPDPDEGDGDNSADPADDASAFEWGVAEPETDPDERRFRIERDLEDEPKSGAERIPMNLGGREEPPSNVDEPEEDDEDDEEHVGPEPGSAPIHAEEVTLENVVFVLLGAVSMVLVLVRLLSLGLG